MSSTPPEVSARHGTVLALREQLSSLRGLLALSMLMTDRRQAEEIVQLVTTAVPALVRARAAGVRLTDRDTVRWLVTSDALSHDRTRADIVTQLPWVAAGGGPVTVPDQPWAWAFPLRSLDEPIGHLVVTADEAPSPADMLLLRSLAQQAGIALANARLHATQQRTNAELARTVEVLRHKTAIHDRFTQVAVTGGGQNGIVTALYELTGLAASIENRGGDVLAWAGPEDVEPRWSGATGRRDRILQRAIREGHPIRIDGRLLTVARPRSDVVGVLILFDPDQRAGEQETVALEHAGTVLAIELARLHSLAETELRLGSDLLADLLAGADDNSCQRAQALGHDLHRPHRVLIVTHPGRKSSPDELVLHVREAVAAASSRRDRPPPLLMPTGQTVVVLLPDGGHNGTGDEDAVSCLRKSLDPGCRIAVGGLCQSPRDFPRSHREAKLVQRLGDLHGRTQAVLRYDDLGVYQVLSEAADPATLDAFVRHWLGPLIDYDAQREADLVTTLSRFLDRGGNYDATATELVLGRTTVRYRLRRIKELTGHDLSDPETRFQLHFATRAWAARNALTDTGTPAPPGKRHRSG
ncbi:MAG TPA: helix-turn-helix domain-containing protein [Pseudonocardiaceae bacterium]